MYLCIAEGRDAPEGGGGVWCRSTWVAEVCIAEGRDAPEGGDGDIMAKNVAL